ncbi:hypothetical protein KW850_12630 [Bacillus sp. sid0103]|uniref:hypothetical protein n=1 Tax=Bacillus sp. sid0103 TaxID=2856337 RepID=UPI001C478A75|nr:hypothetical protein [Bacillus sp. sid0103]MBV7506102.1 hypothetical protein [Bacillus sp. sid0103]
MNTKVKKGIFWGVIIAAMVLMVNVLYYLLGGHSEYAEVRHGYEHGPGGMGARGDFEGRHFLNGGPHHEGGFPWLFLIIGLALVVILVKWLRKKAKAASMNQFIDTSLVSSHTPVRNQNANILEQWEKNLTNKKENA